MAIGNAAVSVNLNPACMVCQGHSRLDTKNLPNDVLRYLGFCVSVYDHHVKITPLTATSSE
jgi:hypothetical protein